MTYPRRVSLIDPAHATLSIARQSSLLDISRSSIYYDPVTDPQDVLVMNAIDRVFTDLPFYGSRRMRRQLADSHNIHIGRDQVRRLISPW